MELIDKASVVAEIERKIKSITSCPFRTAELDSEKLDEGQLNAYNEIISYLCTLEVKEVDLDTVMDEEYNKYRSYNSNGSMLVTLNRLQFNSIAKHFFELGLRTRNEGVK